MKFLHFYNVCHNTLGFYKLNLDVLFSVLDLEMHVCLRLTRQYLLLFPIYVKKSVIQGQHLNVYAIIPFILLLTLKVQLFQRKEFCDKGNYYNIKQINRQKLLKQNKNTRYSSSSIPFLRNTCSCISLVNCLIFILQLKCQALVSI